MKSKRLYSIICMVCLLLSMTVFLSGCTDKAAREVDDLIANIGEVTIESKAAIQAARQAYDALEEKSKENVKNLAMLEDAETKQSALAIDEMIALLGVGITKESVSLVETTRAMYDELDDKVKEKVENLSVLEQAENEAAEFAGEIAADEAKDAFKNFNFDEGVQLLQEYRDEMTEEQLMECMEVYGQWYVFKLVEKNLISRMKDPYSYSRLDGTSSVLKSGGIFSNKYYEEHSTHVADVKIDYRGTNSYGGYMTDSYNASYFFTINLDTLSLNNVKSMLEMTGEAVKAGYSSGSGS